MKSESSIIPIGKSLFITGESFFIETRMPKNIQSTTSSEEEDKSSEEWVEWGSNNSRSQELFEAASKSTVVLPGLRFKSEMQFAGGIVHGVSVADPDVGDVEFKQKLHGEVLKFNRQNNCDLQSFLTLMDLNTYHFACIQFGFNKAFNKIVRFSVEQTRAKWVRFGKLKEGEIQEVFVNADFGTSSFKKESNKTIKVVPSFNPVGWMKENVKKSKPKSVAYLIKLPDLGKAYYPNPDWSSALDSGWMDVAQNIAQFKKYLLENQITLKYHIKVHPEYWVRRAGGKQQWEDMSDDQKITFMQDELATFSDFMKGAKGAGNTWMTAKGVDQRGESFDLIEIDTIDDKLKEGAYIEDSKEASEHLMSALNIHPQMIGNAPGSQLGAGSGSASRVAFNQRTAMARFIQTQVCRAFEVVAEFNGWNSDGMDLEFQFLNSLILTLDSGAEATKPETV